jgi:hypothetical protein
VKDNKEADNETLEALKDEVKALNANKKALKNDLAERSNFYCIVASNLEILALIVVGDGILHIEMLKQKATTKVMKIMLYGTRRIMKMGMMNMMKHQDGDNPRSIEDVCGQKLSIIR